MTKLYKYKIKRYTTDECEEKYIFYTDSNIDNAVIHIITHRADSYELENTNSEISLTN